MFACDALCQNCLYTICVLMLATKVQRSALIPEQNHTMCTGMPSGFYSCCGDGENAESSFFRCGPQNGELQKVEEKHGV